MVGIKLLRDRSIDIIQTFGGDDQSAFWNVTETENHDTIMSILSAHDNSIIMEEEEKRQAGDVDDPSTQYGDSLCEYQLSHKL